MNTKGLFILKTKLPLLLAALFSMTFSAQNLEHVIDMDRFVDNDGFLLSQNNPNPFIGEFSYPSEDMVGPFAGWNKKLKGYEKDQQGQADIYADVIK